jgi:hypothetical protein
VRLGWDGWRRWPPWLVGYLGITLVAASAMVLLLGVSSCADAYGAGFADAGQLAWTAGALILGALMMVLGARMIAGQLSDDPD